MFPEQNLDRKNPQISDAMKASRIMYHLYDLGYEPNNELDSICIIQENNISLEGYELPNNASNIEEWKQSVIDRNRRTEKRKEQSKNIDYTKGEIWWD